MVGPVRTVSVIGSDTSVGEVVAARLAARDVRLVPPGQPAEALVCVDGDGQVDLATTRRALRTAVAEHVVYASTAMVYGAWPNNPVPLTEDAPMRPNPGFDYATSKAEAERAALEWRDATPSGQLAVLRPVTVLGGRPGRLTRRMPVTTGRRCASYFSCKRR